MDPRYFVRVFASDRQMLVWLGSLDLDIVSHTAAHTTAMGAAVGAAEQVAVEALVTLDEVQKLVDAGYAVLVEENADRRARAAREVSTFDEWLKGMLEDLERESS